MVDVNIVYKTVLYILNKEQRGYLTPDEFNKLGIQVQREIFEKYFEDLNQQLRVPQTNNEYADRVRNLEEKIDIFKTSKDCTYVGADKKFTFPTDPALYRLGTLMYEPSGKDPQEIQAMNYNEYFLANKSPLTKPSLDYPVYVLQGTGTPSSAPNNVFVYPGSIINSVKAYYTRIPSDPRWGYYLGSLGQYIYDPTVYSASLLNNGGSLTTHTAFTGAVANSYSNLAYTTTSTGTGLVINAIATGGSTATFSIATPGSGYSVGDEFNITAGAMGGATGFIITLTAANFNSGSTYGSTQFDLHPSEQTNLILNILLYTGVIIRDPNVVQAATALVQQDEVNQKS
jgi:hypothetical protein